MRLYIAYSLTLVMFIFSTSFASAQSNESSFADNLRFGGSFNLSFGSNFTTIGISPSAIYVFSDQFSAGASLSYMYSKGDYYDPIFNEDYKGTSNIYGGSLLALYNPIRGAQLSVEFEQMRVNYSDPFVSNQYWSPAIYLGAAYYSGNFSFGLQYDLLYTTNKSIYSSSITPIFRAYF